MKRVQARRAILAGISWMTCGTLGLAFNASFAADAYPSKPITLVVPFSAGGPGVGFPYALANATFGGTAEYAALALRAAHVESYFFYYVAALTAMTFLASVLMPNLGKHGYLDSGAQATSSSFGEKARLIAATCAGCPAAFAAKPSRRARAVNAYCPTYPGRCG